MPENEIYEIFVKYSHKLGKEQISDTNGSLKELGLEI
jgi:hypothetical protein